MAVRKVLIVDDSATERTRLEGIMSSSGYSVITASSGKEGLERAKRDQPDVVLLDVVMDDMNGFQVCRAITSSDDTSKIPVILVSSKKEKTDAMWGEEQGAKGYVIKPYSDEEILSKVRAL